MRNEISRRDFIRNAGAFGVVGPVAGSRFVDLLNEGETSAPEGLSTRSPGSLQSNVAVIGAGLAGLAAALELAKAGHDVTVLEARTRPGGRVHTVRDPYADNLYSEVGAVAFSETYDQANKYIDELGLKRVDYAFPQLPPVYHMEGHRFSVGADGQTDWPYNLTEEERSLGPMGMVGQYLIQAMPSEMTSPEMWDQPPLSDLDRQSLEEYLLQQGASDGAVELIANTQYFGANPSHTSALSVALADIGLFFSGGGLFLLEGGNDTLPTAMARRLGQDVQYGVEVTAIESRDDGVEIRAVRNKQPVTISADRAIVTVPAPVLQHIDVQPHLSSKKQAALENLVYRNAVRAQVQVRSGFWHDEGVAGAANTDLFAGRIDRQPYGDLGAPDRRAILEAFIEGETAEQLEGRSDPEIIEYALTQIEKVHPQIRDYAEGGTVKVWARDPLARGSYSWPGPGDVTRYLEILREPHQRIHFAGEHTSVLRATMEGALRSGVRAAREVDSAAK